MRTTHTYAILSVSEATYDEIRAKLEDVGYAHCFHPNANAPAMPIIDMQGIALAAEVEMTEGENVER